uniref:NADH-ubiquinone oxidoreductase chain 4L n=1 Tax=Ophiocomina nigra TaxID=55617 RepID=D3H5T9_9ECHI|nr:NADH dehydrogenase 4L [Ophiocomina nigra]
MIFIWSAIFIPLIIALIAIIYKKKFLLSILLCLESGLLLITSFSFIVFLVNNEPYSGCFSLYIITLSAVEASMGISLLTLVTRNLGSNNIVSLNTLIN